MSRVLSPAGQEFIRRRESCVLVPHWDSVGGVWDIGYGHRFKPGEPRVPITQAEANALFAIDSLYYSAEVDRMVKAATTMQQFDALVSFAYNVGWQGLESSTLLKRLNAGLYDAAVVQLLQWNKAKGKKVRGLCARRYDEAMVFAFGDYSHV